MEREAELARIISHKDIKRAEAPRARIVAMITLDDCIAFCGLTQEEVLAVAEHEHVPEITAAAMAEYLVALPHGGEKIRDMIIDDVRQAQAVGDKAHVVTLLHVLHHFLKAHPEVMPLHHPWNRPPIRVER